MAEVVPGHGGSYGRLFAEPVLRRLAMADVCARLPQGMLSMTLLLVAAQYASMRAAGLVLAGCTLGQAGTGPLRGRLADRHGLFPVATVCGAGYLLALVGLLAAALARSPAIILAGAGLVAGLVTPPLSPGLRSLWSRHAGDRLRPAAFALDAAVFDLAYLAGPVVASALATGAGPVAALVVLLGLTSAGVAAVRPYSRYGDAPPGRGSLLGLRCFPALRRLLVTAALANTALSAAEVALTAYARSHHALWASGPLLAGVSAGSITGSLLLGARARGGNGRSRLSRLLACYTLGLAGLTAAGLYAPLLAVAAPLAGLFLGPTLATLFADAAASAPHGSGTEAQSWLNSIMNGGAAAGAALAGLAAGHPILGLAVPAVAAALATASAVGTARGRGNADVAGDSRSAVGNG
ncbi:MAG TPA: MFS transporter [Streptosporangiaceae bacterium]|nr:MFS transporter [Streptosporangiaceae bacterium]